MASFAFHSFRRVIAISLMCLIIVACSQLKTPLEPPAPKPVPTATSSPHHNQARQS